MLIDLVDSLRCVVPHEESWLVAAVARMDARQVVEGTLGCPLCGSEYPIVDRVARFDVVPGAPPVPDVRATARVSAFELPEPADHEMPTRLAALLGLTEPNGLAMLSGALARFAPAVAELTRVHVIALDPAAPPRALDHGGVSVLFAPARLPLAAGALRGAAFGPDVVGDRVATAVATLKARGRLVAPAGSPLPEGVREIARDARDWLAERLPTPSPAVPLTLARGRGR